MSWHKNTELVAICLHLTPEVDMTLPANYTYGLLGWWLDRIRQDNPDLSTYLHDGGSEKPFTLSRLEGVAYSSPLRLVRGNSYQWTISALYQPLCQWLASWLKTSPKVINLYPGNLTITDIEVVLAPTTYEQLWQAPLPLQRKFKLDFISPTSFRSKGHHLPLPLPHNLFHSYLRRWNDFSPYPCDQEEFLDWVAEMVFVSGHSIATSKIQAGKSGVVTGFTGWVEFGVEAKSDRTPDKQRLLYTLLGLAPYCGTGHKTTFGLGCTQLASEVIKIPKISPPLVQTSPKTGKLSDRLGELTALFFEQKKRQGGSRASYTAELWATILVRWEQGENLRAIAIDLSMPYETVRTYAKRARRAVKAGD